MEPQNDKQANFIENWESYIAQLNRINRAVASQNDYEVYKNFKSRISKCQEKLSKLIEEAAQYIEG